MLEFVTNHWMMFSLPLAIFALWRFIKYLMFRRILYLLMNQEAIFADNEDEVTAYYKKYNSKPTDREDERLRSERKEKKVEVIQPQKKFERQDQSRVVGISQRTVFGKFTAIFAKKFMSEITQLNPALLRDKGYFQAKLIAERQSTSIGKTNSGFGK